MNAFKRQKEQQQNQPKTIGSFPWKRIENKPDNSEDITKLIDDVNKKNYTVNIEQSEMLLRKFVEKFNFNNFFELELESDNNSSKDNKKRKISNKERILEESFLTSIQKDFDLFTMDDKNSILHQNFIYKINNYLYILWWCICLLKKNEEKKIKSLLLLDATISLNRLLNERVITNEKYLVGFTKVNSLMNALIKEKHYNTLFDNPKMLLHSSFESQDKKIGLYPEQRLVLDTIHEAICNKRPLLLGNQMPTGQGKTFLSVPLAKMLSTERNKLFKKCVLFSCSNDLVNMDVASSALCGNELHLWLGKTFIVEEFSKELNKMIRVKKVVIRPYKRCFPLNWKQIYKQNDEDKLSTIEKQWTYYVKVTQKVPDILVCDLESCYEILKVQDNLMNSFEYGDDSPLIGYIDEYVSDYNSNILTSKISEYLPKQTVLLSSILPKFENISSVVTHFCKKYNTCFEEACVRVCSADVNIPCVIIDPEGYIRLPHHNINNPEDLSQLIIEMDSNPRIRRLYSPKHTYFWIKTISHLLPKKLQFQKKFPNIGSINLRDINTYVIKVLIFLLDHFELLENFKEYRPKYMDKVDLEKIFENQSKFYEGKTLLITNDSIKRISEISKNLYNTVHYQKIEKLIKDRDNEKKKLQKKQSILVSKNKTTKNKSTEGKSSKTFKVDKVDMINENSDIRDEIFSNIVKIHSEFVLNTKEHFKRFNKDENQLFERENTTYLDDEYFESFSDEHVYNLFSGILLYEKNKQTDYQRDLLMKVYNQSLFFCSGIDVVYGTNLSNLENIFIDDDFAKDVTIPTLYQLMGRVGRIGRSYHANIITNSENTIKKLFSLDDNIDKQNDIEKLFMNENL